MITADQSHTDLYTETITALTRAARQRQPDGTPSDFGDFLAHALAATAANVGGPDQLVAGRPGSWESAYIDGLVRGTIGDQSDAWTWYRTQPVVIHLNVAELIEDELHHPGLMGLDEALENIGRRHESAASEQDLDVWDREIETITDRYISEYRHYAERFTTSARRVANDVPGLTADVFVEADTDPNSTWWSTGAINNSNRLESDPVAVEIWCCAHLLTSLPNVDVWLGVGG